MSHAKLDNSRQFKAFSPCTITLDRFKNTQAYMITLDRFKDTHIFIG